MDTTGWNMVFFLIHPTFETVFCSKLYTPESREANNVPDF
jgi:hypothetical protein